MRRLGGGQSVSEENKAMTVDKTVPVMEKRGLKPLREPRPDHNMWEACIRIHSAGCRRV